MDKMHDLEMRDNVEQLSSKATMWVIPIFADSEVDQFTHRNARNSAYNSAAAIGPPAGKKKKKAMRG